jgi:hypothetical protein
MPRLIWSQGAMSQRDLEAVIGRAVLSQEFRLFLFADPDAALADYELTEAERVALESVDAESLDACAANPGKRIVRLLATGDRNSEPMR